MQQSQDLVARLLALSAETCLGVLVAADPVLDGVVVALTGMTVPKGSPERVRAEVVDPHLVLVRFLTGLEGGVADVAGATTRGARGAAVDAYLRALSKFASGDGADYIKGLKDTALQLADAGSEFAYQLEYTNMMIVEQVILFFADLAVIAVLEIFNPVQAAFEKLALDTFFRELFTTELTQMLARIAAQTASIMTMNGVLAAALDGFTRWILATQGKHTAHGGQYRDQSLKFGAIQGAVSSLVPFAMRPIGKGIGKLPFFGPKPIKNIQDIIAESLHSPAPTATKTTLPAGEKAALGGEKALLSNGKTFDRNATRDLWNDPLNRELHDGNWFGSEIGRLIVPMAVHLQNGVVRRGARQTFRNAVGDQFARAFAERLGWQQARESGRVWADTFMAHTGRGPKTLGRELEDSLHWMPTGMGGLRGALSHDLARALSSPSWIKFVRAFPEAGLQAAAMNLSEGLFNLNETGKFTTSWMTTAGGAGAALGSGIGHIGAVKLGHWIKGRLGFDLPHHKPPLPDPDLALVSKTGGGHTPGGSGMGGDLPGDGALLPGNVLPTADASIPCSTSWSAGPETQFLRLEQSLHHWQAPTELTRHATDDADRARLLLERPAAAFQGMQHLQQLADQAGFTPTEQRRLLAPADAAVARRDWQQTVTHLTTFHNHLNTALRTGTRTPSALTQSTLIADLGTHSTQLSFDTHGAPAAPDRPTRIQSQAGQKSASSPASAITDRTAAAPTGQETAAVKEERVSVHPADTFTGSSGEGQYQSTHGWTELELFYKNWITHGVARRFTDGLPSELPKPGRLEAAIGNAYDLMPHSIHRTNLANRIERIYTFLATRNWYAGPKGRSDSLASDPQNIEKPAGQPDGDSIRPLLFSYMAGQWREAPEKEDGTSVMWTQWKNISDSKGGSVFKSADAVNPAAVSKESDAPHTTGGAAGRHAAVGSDIHILPMEVELYHEVNLRIQQAGPGAAHIDAADVAVIHQQLAANGGLARMTVREIAGEISAVVLGYDLPRLRGGGSAKLQVDANAAGALQNAWANVLAGKKRLVVTIKAPSVPLPTLVDRILERIDATAYRADITLPRNATQFKIGNHKLLLAYQSADGPKTLSFEVTLEKPEDSAGIKAGPSRLPEASAVAVATKPPMVGTDKKFEVGAWFSRLVHDRLGLPVMLVGDAQIAMKWNSLRLVADLDFQAEVPHVASRADELNDAIRRARPDAGLAPFVPDVKEKDALTGWIDGVEITIGPSATKYTDVLTIDGIRVASNLDAVMDKAYSFAVQTGEKQQKDLFDLLWSLHLIPAGSVVLRDSLEALRSEAFRRTDQTGTLSNKFAGKLAAMTKSKKLMLELEQQWTAFGATKEEIFLLREALDDLKGAFRAGAGPHRAVMVTAGNFTGDMFGMSAALVLNPKLHVTILTGPQHTDQVGDFLHRSLETRVRAGYDLLYAKLHKQNLRPKELAVQEAALQTRLQADLAAERERIHLLHSQDPHALYTTVTRKGEPLPYERVRPPIPENLQSRHFQRPVAHATEEVTVRWDNQSHERTKVRTAWGLGDRPDVRAGAFLDEMGVPKRGKYVVLWSRFSGKRGGAHPQHDTSLTGMRQLIDALPGEVTVIIAGDKTIGGTDRYKALANVHENIFDLTEFWKSGSWNRHFLNATRADQFKVFDHLARREGSTLKHLGFRSGNLEPYALIGHDVRYLEEAGNLQAGRLESWHQTVGYERITVSKVPTLSGQWVTGSVKSAGSEPTLPWRTGTDLQAVREAKHAMLRDQNVKVTDRGFAREDLSKIGAYLGFTTPDPMPAPPDKVVHSRGSGLLQGWVTPGLAC
ncbi:hypothetical protein ACH4C2_37635 [Streptomyces sp. NPDC018057]|uniref:hypothetical protein n=1 Tax=unclassified Streptomyces TaxID=2593676 RepID=UPI0037B9228D